MLRRYPASCSTSHEVWVDFKSNILPRFADQACLQFAIEAQERNPPAARDGFSCVYVMLIGGGEGMGKLEEIAKALAQMSGFALQLLHFGTSLFEISLNELVSVP